MNFKQSAEYLYSLGNEVETMKLGLENVRKLIAALGNPEKNYLKVQVAGTNGKGSVCAFLDSICLQAGIKTGRFTSPHLVSITERVKIGGEDIGEADFARHATRVRETSERLVAEGLLESVPTYFEQVTAIALIAFAEAKVEFAILETGLGGRLDATTAANAEIAAITQIALDHQNYLGETIEEIAAEKAAIIRPDSRVIVAHQNAAVERVISGRCREVGVDPKWATRDITIKKDREIEPFLFATIITEFGSYPNVIPMQMPGRHQFANAAVAIAIAEALRDLDFDISWEAIMSGLENARHPGRLERIGRFLLDGAHNVAGAKALVDYLDEFETRPITMIYGTMQDKDVADITKILFPKAGNLILTRPYNSRAMPTDELLRFVSDRKVHVTENATDAIDLANCLVGDGIVLATGSLYLVGEIKAFLTPANL